MTIKKTLTSLIIVGAISLSSCSKNIEERIKQDKYEHFWTELFKSHEYKTPGGSSYAIYGLADENENGLIELEEQVKVWNKMGYRGPFFVGKSRKQFPEPSLTELKKARDWYRKNLNRDFPRVYPSKYK